MSTGRKNGMSLRYTYPIDDKIEGGIDKEPFPSSSCPSQQHQSVILVSDDRKDIENEQVEKY